MNLFNDHLNLSNNIYDNAKILKSVQINKQQELVNRNPTTKYYQSLALNLQEQINNMKKMLNEVNAPLPTQGTPSLANELKFATPAPPDFEPKHPFRNPDGTPPAAPKGTNPPPCTCEIGSEEWKKWIRQKGHWTYENIHPYGTPEWEAFELMKARQRVKK